MEELIPLQFVHGNLFDSGAEALVNPVNCVGVMGAGLAKQFDERFPGLFKAYRRLYHAGMLRPGCPITLPSHDPTIVLFPTKDHWRNPSQLRWVASGLGRLRDEIAEYSITSIAVPPLGCGLGGLRWGTVKQHIIRMLGDLDCDVLVYEPKGGGKG